MTTTTVTVTKVVGEPDEFRGGEDRGFNFRVTDRGWVEIIRVNGASVLTNAPRGQAMAAFAPGTVISVVLTEHEPGALLGPPPAGGAEGDPDGDLRGLHEAQPGGAPDPGP